MPDMRSYVFGSVVVGLRGLYLPTLMFSLLRKIFCVLSVLMKQVHTRDWLCGTLMMVVLPWIDEDGAK